MTVVTLLLSASLTAFENSSIDPTWKPYAP